MQRVLGVVDRAAAESALAQTQSMDTPLVATQNGRVDEAKARAWFETLLSERPGLVQGAHVHYDERAVSTWAAEADTAIKGVFQSGAPIVSRWNAALNAVDSHDRSQPYTQIPTYEKLYAAFDAAKKLLDAGRLSTLIDGIRLETVSEVLDQADLLVRQHCSVPATVLAGGALETHLRHLCDRHGLTIVGDRSINAYDAAITGARKSGNEIYSKGDSKQVIAWGDRRNGAAHDPVNFRCTDKETALMVDGIRQFIARTA